MVLIVAIAVALSGAVAFFALKNRQDAPASPSATPAPPPTVGELHKPIKEGDCATIITEMEKVVANDLFFIGEGLGAYGTKSDLTQAVVRTKELSAEELIQIREDLIKKYKFATHTTRHKEDAKFFDTHLKENVEYSTGGDLGCKS